MVSNFDIVKTSFLVYHIHTTYSHSSMEQEIIPTTPLRPIRPLFATIVALILIVLAIGILILLLVGGLFTGLIISTGTLAFILTIGVIAVLLQIGAAIGVLLMRRWTIWLLLGVIIVSSITPIKSALAGNISWQSFVLPTFFAFVSGYLIAIRKQMR